MTNALKERLDELQKEYDAGQKMLAELETKRQTLTSTMLRIEGAMQILRELIEKEPSSEGTPPRA